MSLANESKPDRNSHYVDLLRSAKRLLLPHGYCDFVYSSTVSRGSPDKPDGETIFNVLRCAVHINSGRIIYNFGFQESLRTFLKPIFTGEVVEENGSCSAAFYESAALRESAAGLRPLSQNLTVLPALPKGEPRALPETFSLHLIL